MVSINPNVVVIGGGTGTTVVLEGLKKYDVNLTAIVPATDSGGHSGMLRKELNIIPPGDIRNCLLTLSESNPKLKQVFSYRFANGSMMGANIGNLFLAALSQIHGSFQSALYEAHDMLNAKGRVFPSTWENVHICAKLSDGTIVETEKEVDKDKKSPIEEVFLKPDNVKASQEAMDAVKNADLIIIGPGSLYTSILPNLLLQDLVKAIKDSRAEKVFVCNIMTQRGQTDGYSTSNHVQILEKYLGKGILNKIIINTAILSKDLITHYSKYNATVIENDKQNLQNYGIIEADLLDNKIVPPKLEEPGMVKHEPNKLAKILMGLLQQ